MSERGRRTPNGRRGALDSVVVPRGSLDLESSPRQDDGPSVMFPRGRRGSEPARVSKEHTRVVPQHISKPSQSGMSDTDTMLNGMLAYRGEDDTRSLKSNHLGGSRPASPSGKAPTASKAFSITSGTTVEGAAQYLYLHDPPSRASRPTVVGGSSRSVNRMPGLVVPPPAQGAASSMHGSVIDEQEERSPVSQVAELLSAPEAGPLPRKRSSPAIPLELGPQHAWYLLRTLIGLEVSNEAKSLHRLTNLSPGYEGGRARGFGDDQQNDFEYGDEAEVGSRELPILRYLIKHFLLTLPFLREVTPQSVDMGMGGRDDTFDGGDVPYYWRAGVLPMLRALHSAALSEPVDLGRRSLGSILFGIYGSHSLERFVASGLRIAGQSPEDPLDQAGAAIPASSGARSPTISRTENPFTKSMLASPQGRRSKGFSGLFQRKPTDSTRASVLGAPDLAGPKPAGHIEPVANELSSDADSDEEDEHVAARNRRAAEAALAGGAAAAAVASVAEPKTPPAKRPASTSSKKGEALGHDRRPSQAISAAETDDTGDMLTAENGEITEALSGVDHEGRPSGASTIGHQSRISAVTASEGNSIDETPSIAETPGVADGGIISAVVGFITGTSAIDPPAATSTPKKVVESELPAETDEADRTVLADGAAATPVLDDGASEMTAAPLPGALIEPSDNKHLSTGTGHDIVSEPEDAVKPKEEEADGYDVPDAPQTTEVKDSGVGMLWGGPPAKPAEESAAEEPATAPGSPTKARAPDSPAKVRHAIEPEPTKRPPRSSSRPGTKRTKEEKAEEAKRRKENMAAVVATGSEAPKEKKRGFSISSLASSMRRGKTPSNVERRDAPASPENRRKPSDQDWYAPLNLPHSATGRGTSGRMTIDSAPTLDGAAINDYSPNDLFSAPVTGHNWPWGTPVPFWKGTPVHRVAWGGFEADVVGVRKGFAGHAYIIRVRRPQRLDEYVLRDESQFKKYLGILDKQYPHAHLRSIPEGKISKVDDAVDPSALASALLAKQQAKAEKRKTDNSFMRPISFSGRSQGGRDLARSEGGRPLEDEEEEEEEDRRQSMGKKPSRLSMRLKQASSFYGDDSRSNRLSKSAPGSRRGTVSGPPRAAPGRLPPRMNVGVDEGEALPYNDPQRRALRNWLRDTLSVRTIGHNRETAAFLLLGSVRLREPEQRDVQKRYMIDEGRRAGRINVAQGAADRAKAGHQIYTSVLDEIVMGDGLLAISEAMRDCPRVDQLPPRFQKALEWSRFSTAQALHDLLVAGEHSGPLFLKLKRLNASVPWFLLRQAFKLPNAGLMTKALQDLLLSNRFGKQSMLHKGLVAILDDDPKMLNDQIEACRARIQSTGICEKLTRFVYSSRENKDLIRRHAAEHNMELVVTIARGAEEPRLDRYDLERVVRAAKVYKSYMKRNPTPAAKVKTENGSVRLILDMQVYLRLLSRERDANEIRGVLSDDRTADALKVLIAPLMEFLRRAYRDADMARVISDLQKFIDQLIVIIDALRARIQDPQKAVRIIARLLSRHTQPFYSFIHTLHREDTVIEEFFQWLWTATTFLRRGLAKQIDLAALMPRDANDRRFLLEELDAVVEYHKRKRQRQYELMCRRFAGDIDSDDPVIVEGDGFGKSRLEPLVESEPRVPRLYEIPRLAESFRAALVGIFSV